MAKRRRKLPDGLGLYWRKDSSSIWMIDPRDGKKRSTRTDVVEQAVALISKLKTEVFETEHFPARAVANKRATLDEAVEQFLAERAHKASIDDDRQRLTRAVEHFGDQPLVEIARVDVIDFLTGLGLAPATRNRYRAALHSCWALAVKNRLANENPVAEVELLPEDNERDRIATQDELDRLIEGADPELRSAIVIAVWSGMRLGEIVGIEPGWIDREGRVIRIPQASTKARTARTVPMAAAVVEALAEFEGFKSTNGNISGRFARLTERLGIPDLRFHDLRHTACTRMRRAGVDVMTMATISGHKTLEQLRRYMTIDEDDQLNAVRAVESMVCERVESKLKAAANRTDQKTWSL